MYSPDVLEIIIMFPNSCLVYSVIYPCILAHLQINGEIIAGYSSDKASKCIKKAAANNIKLAVRDRPFERTITMQKDSTNHVGFSYNNGEIKAIVKDSSAARYVLREREREREYMYCRVGNFHIIKLGDVSHLKQNPHYYTLVYMHFYTFSWLPLTIFTTKISRRTLYYVCVCL